MNAHATKPLHRKIDRKRMLGALALAILTSVLANCNATKGMGKDMENLGENIQDSAEKSKP